MYCKGCNSLLEENNAICPKCGLDNNALLEETTEIYLNKISNPRDMKNKKNKLTIVLCLFFSLSIFIIGIYIFKDSSKADINNSTTSKTTEKVNEKIKTFKFDSIKLKYPKDTYGTSTNTIFLKSDNSINIVLKNISSEEYNTQITANEVLDDYLGEIPTKTFANENSYFHTFIVKNNYYLIEVNHKGLETSEETKLELSKIIKSLTIK